jgi:hypothetical protein
MKYHQIQICEGDEWKKTFKTNEELYECMVKPFEFMNAPNIFMRIMNAMLKLYLGTILLWFV